MGIYLDKKKLKVKICNAEKSIKLHLKIVHITVSYLKKC